MLIAIHSSHTRRCSNKTGLFTLGRLCGDKETQFVNFPNPRCTCFMSHNAQFRTEMYTFLFWMKHSGIWNRCILGFGNYCQFSNIRRILVGNLIVDHSNVVGASPVDAAPTSSSCLDLTAGLMDWAKTTARWNENHLSFGIWCDLYQIFYSRSIDKCPGCCSPELWNILRTIQSVNRLEIYGGQLYYATCWKKFWWEEKHRPIWDVCYLLHVYLHDDDTLNSLRPGDTYMHHRNWYSLVQLMACHLPSAKLLPEPKVIYFLLDL